MNSQHLYTARGNVRYDVLLPLWEILIFIGATRILSFKSTPKTTSGFLDCESPSQGMRLKNLDAALVSVLFKLKEGEVGVGGCGPRWSSSRWPGRKGAASCMGVKERFSKNSSSGGRPPLRILANMLDLRDVAFTLGRHSPELPLPNELTLRQWPPWPAVKNACLSVRGDPDSSPGPWAKDTSVGVSRETPSVFASDSSRMMPSPSVASDWIELMDVLRVLLCDSGSEAGLGSGPSTSSGEMTFVRGRKTSGMALGVAGPDTDGLAVAPNMSSWSGINSGTSHGWAKGNREILHDISGGGDARGSSSGRGGRAFWAAGVGLSAMRLGCWRCRSSSSRPSTLPLASSTESASMSSLVVDLSSSSAYSIRPRM